MLFELLIVAALGAAEANADTATGTLKPAEADRVHVDAIVIDGHIDTPSAILDLGVDPGVPQSADCQPAMPSYDGALPKRTDGNYCTHFDFARAKTGGLDAAFLSLWIDTALIGKSPAEGGGAARRAIDLIDATRANIAKNSDKVVLATTVADIRQASKDGKFAALLGIEGGHAIEHSLAVLRLFHERGVRYLTLTHSKTHDWADSSGDAKDKTVKHHGGLTDFGRSVVREMNRLGMVVDVSHASDETFADVIEVAQAPLIASHSSARALTPHWRNVTDDMARAVAKNGGVVMVNFNEPFIGAGPDDTPEHAKKVEAEFETKHPDNGARAEWEFTLWREKHWPAAPLTRLVDHIDHLAKVAGWQHVGLGSDFDGVMMLPGGIAGVQDLPKITRELAKRGYTAEQLTGMLGGNTLRVLEAVERHAATY